MLVNSFQNNLNTLKLSKKILPDFFITKIIGSYKVMVGTEIWGLLNTLITFS